MTLLRNLLTSMLECRALSPSPSKKIKVEPECIPRQEELFIFEENSDGILMYREIDVADLEPFKSEMVQCYVNFFHQSNKYYEVQETHLLDTHFSDTAQTLRSIPPLEQTLAANANYLHNSRNDLAELVTDPLSLFLPDPPHGLNLSNIEVTLADRSDFFYSFCYDWQMPLLRSGIEQVYTLGLSPQNLADMINILGILPVNG